MPYTLGKNFVWFLGAGALGAIIGWMLHHLMKCSRPGHGAAQEVVTDTAEVDRLKARVANLEPAVRDRDALRAEVESLKASAAVPVPVASFAGVSMDDHSAVVSERDDLRAQLVTHRESITTQNETIARHEASLAAHRETIATHEAAVGHMQGLLDAAASASAAAPVLDAAALASGATLLGKPLKLDDLKVVEGIGPRIEELCHERGIRTWHELSQTDHSVLQSMLEEAGPRFQMHDPGSWPRQAKLLANGQWTDFKELTDRLDGGR